MKRLMAESYLLLLWTEFIMLFVNLKALHRQLQRREPRNSSADRCHHVDGICRAMDVACAFYPKQVLCLQRSVATTLLLRRYGIRAEMLIGAQLLPFKSHAWVEVDGTVVNDKPYMREIYRVLESC
jgi:hypothetical protein